MLIAVSIGILHYFVCKIADLAFLSSVAVYSSDDLHNQLLLLYNQSNPLTNHPIFRKNTFT